ncbi:MAG: 3-isopropylmalate dehydrogenase [Bacteroidia bacterium]|nr:3-isopropylmalate dehydrogenase [Bacteroidia bacterium]
MQKKITVIEGDGIGPEVVQQAIKVLDAVCEKYGHNFNYDHQLMGAVAIYETGEALPKECLESCMYADAVLLGAVGDPAFDNNPEAKVRPEQGLLALRKALQLFANVRPVKAYDRLMHMAPVKPEILQGVDFVIFRELTGGIYFGEKKVDKDYTQASDLCSYSRMEVERIARMAFEMAQKRAGKLCLVDKANVLETSRLWRKVVKEITTDYPDVELSFLFVDNAAMQLILNPSQFDVIVTENMFGDILSDEASILSGSLGMMPSASKGTGTALFEPVHGSYPQAKGKDIANPMATIQAAAMMLDHFGLTEEAKAVDEAIDWAMEKGMVTKDINPESFFPTSIVGDLIASKIANDIDHVNNKYRIYNQSTII